MGCCQSENALPPKLQHSIPMEEECIKNSEHTLLALFFTSQVVKASESSERYEKILQYFEVSAEDPISRLVICFILVSDKSVSVKAKEILSVWGKENFTRTELYILIETLVELSSRTLPFLVFRHMILNKSSFQHYVSTLSKSKKIFKEQVFELILKNSYSISADELAYKLVCIHSQCPLLSSHCLRLRLWTIFSTTNHDKKILLSKYPCRSQSYTESFAFSSRKDDYSNLLSPLRDLENYK